MKLVVGSLQLETWFAHPMPDGNYDHMIFSLETTSGEVLNTGFCFIPTTGDSSQHALFILAQLIVSDQYNEITERHIIENYVPISICLADPTRN